MAGSGSLAGWHLVKDGPTFQPLDCARSQSVRGLAPTEVAAVCAFRIPAKTSVLRRFSHMESADATPRLLSWMPALLRTDVLQCDVFANHPAPLWSKRHSVKVSCGCMLAARSSVRTCETAKRTTGCALQAIALCRSQHSRLRDYSILPTPITGLLQPDGTSLEVSGLVLV